MDELPCDAEMTIDHAGLSSGDAIFAQLRRIVAVREITLSVKRRQRTGSLKSANSAKIAHVSECEGKSQKLTSRARLIKAIHKGVEDSLPEILANFRGPISMGGE